VVWAFLSILRHSYLLQPPVRTHSHFSMGDRGRSRVPREAGDDTDNSFESYDSYSSASEDDTSYEAASEPSTPTPSATESMEYESDGSGSYSIESDTEPPTPTPSATEYESDDDEYEDDDDGDADHTVPQEISGDSSSSTSSQDETDAFEDDYGEFADDDDGFDYNNKYKGKENTEDKDRSDEGDSDTSDEESDDNENSGNNLQLGEQDDDLFWKRYGYSQQIGNIAEGSSTQFESNPFNADSSSHDSPSNSSSDDGTGFDDGDTFKDDLYSTAFPSIANQDRDSSSKLDTRNRLSGGGGTFVNKMKGRLKCDWIKSKKMKGGSCCGFSADFLQGNFKWYLLVIIILLGVGVALAVVLPKDGKDDTTNDTLVDMPPTATPSVSSSPTLPPGQVMEAVTFFSLIPNANEDDITEEELEIEFSAAFDVLALQVLLNATELNIDDESDSSDFQENQTAVVVEQELNYLIVRLRGRRRRRKLDASSVKFPVLVDVVEIVCPDTVPNSGSEMCVRATADIILITDDGTIGFDYYTAMEDAIEGGQLQTASYSTGSNLTIVTLDKEDIITPSPTMSLSPTKSPRPTASLAPTSSCYDKESNCEDWANQDPSECDANPEYMNSFCPKSCGFCVTDSPSTASPTNSPIVSSTDSPVASSSTASPTNSNSTSPTNLPIISSTESPVASPTNFSTASPTFSTTELTTPSISEGPSNNDTATPSPTFSPCVDKNDACAEFLEGGGCLLTKCALWAGEDECNTNRSYMANSCAKSCNNCGAELPSGSPTPVEDLGTGGPTPVEDPGTESNAPVPTSAPTKVACVDKNARCDEWTVDGQCSSNPDYMLENCKLSCNVCESEGDDQVSPNPSPCVDNNNRCAEWAAGDQCSSNPDYMLENCKLSCNVCEIEGDDQLSPTPSPQSEGDDQVSPTQPSPCVDDNDGCTEWAAGDQCSSNPEYMLQNCKASCGVCGSSDGSECKDSKEDCYESSESGECILTKCAFWAQEGECESNTTYMSDNCSKSCEEC